MADQPPDEALASGPERLELERLRRQYADDDGGLSNDELLAVARRVAELAPRDPDSWWALATLLDWMLGDLDGEALRSDPRFGEMIRAHDHVVEFDPHDVTGPYNRARNLSRAGLFEQAYESFLLAGRTEAAHPSDIDWPAAWHYQSAAEEALSQGRLEAAAAAVHEAVRVCGQGDPEVQALVAWLHTRRSG